MFQAGYPSVGFVALAYSLMSCVCAGAQNFTHPVWQRWGKALGCVMEQSQCTEACALSSSQFHVDPYKGSTGACWHSHQHLAQKVTLKYANQFVYSPPEDRDFSKFIEQVTMVVQDFAQAGIAAQDLGMPFASMKPGILQGGQMPYDIKADKLQRLQENIIELVHKIDAAAVA